MTSSHGTPDNSENIIIEKKIAMKKGNLWHFESHSSAVASINSPSSSTVTNPTLMQEQL